MKVFLTGATGAIGRRIVPRLVERGHEVVGMTRSPSKEGMLRDLGAEPVVADGLDRRAVVKAIRRAEPEVVVHEMTAISDIKSFRKLDQEFELTNRLRAEGTDTLIEGARLAGARRVVAQSFGGWTSERTGGWVKTEEDPLDPNPPKAMSQSLAAIRHLEAAVTSADGLEGVVLRYGGFYGAGSTLGEGGDFLEQIRKRRLPIVGDGAGRWSFIQLDDAASATVLAIEGEATGIYNVSDDEPAPVSEWLPYLARVLGAPPPRHVPVWLGRLLAGEPGVSMFTKSRGVSNAKFKDEFGWTLEYPSWRKGFRTGMGASADAVAA
jgi:nucleoside-diphosphate-sugar epimerase